MINFFRKKENVLSVLENTKRSFWDKIKNVISPKKNVITDDLIFEIEQILVSLDFGLDQSEFILKKIITSLEGKKDISYEVLSEYLKKVCYDLIPENFIEKKEIEVPYIIILLGINGSGKTTTVAKLSHLNKKQNKKVLNIGADSFRAAAFDQLKIWSDKVGVDFFSKEKVSPSAIVFDGLDYSIKNSYEVVLIDTAGRMHTNVSLMDELNKIYRTVKKFKKDGPDEVLLVLDGNSGQNVMIQAEKFIENCQATSFVVTKLDGISKGGIVASCSIKFKKPIRYLGVGEKLDDLINFDKKKYLEYLFDDYNN